MTPERAEQVEKELAEVDAWKQLSVTAIAAENLSVAEYVLELESRAAAAYDLLRKCSHYLHWIQYGECRTQEDPVPDAVELVELIDAEMGKKK